MELEQFKVDQHLTASPVSGFFFFYRPSVSRSGIASELIYLVQYSN